LPEGHQIPAGRTGIRSLLLLRFPSLQSFNHYQPRAPIIR